MDRCQNILSTDTLWDRQSWKELTVVTDAYVDTTATHADKLVISLGSQIQSDRLQITVWTVISGDLI